MVKKNYLNLRKIFLKQVKFFETRKNLLETRKIFIAPRNPFFLFYYIEKKDFLAQKNFTYLKKIFT